MVFVVNCPVTRMQEGDARGVQLHRAGSDAAKRVLWSRRFTMNEASKYLTVDFINGKEWLPAFYY